MRQILIISITCVASSYALKLKINLAKSELVRIGVVEDVGSLASILGCKVFSFPMKYMCLPLGAQFGMMEVALSLKGWWVTLIKKYFIQFSHLFLVLFLHHGWNC